jgi:predicted RNA-binding protein (virulence factor B family)
MKKDCLHCKLYRLDDISSGVCRLKKDVVYPLKRNEDCCPSWRDCGQQYYIRLGWIKARKEAAKSAP